MNLPKSFVSVAAKYGISKEEIIFAAMADFDSEYRFADTIVALTAEKLVLAAYPYREKEEYRFGGYGGWQITEGRTAGKESLSRERAALAQEPALQIFELQKVGKTEVIRQVSTGVLLGEIDGVERNLCHFSNTRMESFLKVCSLAQKLKKGEEISEEDLDIQKGKECCPQCGMLYPDQERKICPKCMDKKSILFRVLSYFKPYKKCLVVMMLCYLGTAALNLVWPYLSGTILYDRILAKDEAFLAFLHIPAGRFMTALTVLVLAMIVAKVLIQALGILQGVLTAKIAPEVVAKLKSQVFGSMGRLSISFYSKRQTGGLMTRVSDDAEEIAVFFIDGIPYFFINAGTILATTVIMFMLNPVLALVSVILMPVLVVISYRMIPHLWHYYGKRHRANRRLKGQMNENFTGARVVKAFGQQEQEMTRFAKNNGKVKTAEMDLVRYDNKFFALYCSVEDAISFLVWAVGGAMIIGGSNVELGMLLTFSGYVGQLRGPLEFMSRIIRWYTQCMNSAQRMFEIIDAVPEVKEMPNPLRPEKLRGEIELKDVTFGYEANKPILKNISFHVQAGEVFGIVGRSGAGKSTLVNLISRLYDTQEGEVLVDGVNVKQYGFRELRKNVAMVSQETYIFMGTVAENIAYARPEATREEIIRAAVQANAHDFICKMPEGYDTLLGSSSRSLSGGEKQRISIARAILADPKILILDEATSAVDTETELAIQKSLEKLEKGRTVLSIAHRLSTLRNATHLIVLDDGRLTESGTHEELLAQKGTYYKLSELQTKALAMRGIE
ncbi:ABC transporter ATP-binding protein/permease [Acetatifactor muris]|uniref:Putative ABC transporter ATP-binding protein n=1 Tax=Acetatifactor muris TaxID=879566 RepID=A0A2K4ZDK5_9FIRM|nr:ABC transporter ATP-binding protein [Acetatifactor muris]MCR2046884.1 ABC transporter ATP-binding protein/permease [Acetatifactor muris]SOY28530.1 putative ABC transporter ATP-binding protein [Acetatifactor muris]